MTPAACPIWWRRRTRDDDFESRIDVWKGCVAIIPPELDGALAAREFRLFQAREDKLRPSYLKLLLRTEYFQGALCALTTGHAHRRRTPDDDFEDLEIFLPGVDVQARIVQVVQDRERAVRADTRDVDRLVGEVERCVRGELSADELLATQDGRYALVLGDGCDGAVPGVNVVLEQEHMSDTPCGKNPVGECDVAWS